MLDLTSNSSTDPQEEWKWAVGFEERELSEVYHHESEKVYEPTVRLKRVH